LGRGAAVAVVIFTKRHGRFAASKGSWRLSSSKREQPMAQRSLAMEYLVKEW